jgi:hypothetical protein
MTLLMFPVGNEESSTNKIVYIEIHTCNNLSISVYLCTYLTNSPIIGIYKT